MDSADISVLNADFTLFVPHSLELKTTSEARNLSVVMDSDLNFKKHIKAITKVRLLSREKYFMVWWLSRTRRNSPKHLSLVGNCNSIHLKKKSLRQLQLIQNSAAGVLTKTKKIDRVTPVLKYLHWLPVTRRIDFKVLMLVYKAPSGLRAKIPDSSMNQPDWTGLAGPA